MSVVHEVPEDESEKPLGMPLYSGHGLEIRWEERVLARMVVTGEVDLDNAERFATELARAVRSRPRLIVDLSGLEFMGSAGISALYRHHGGLTAVLVAGDSLISRALGYAGFSSLVPVIDIAEIRQSGTTPALPQAPHQGDTEAGTA